MTKLAIIPCTVLLETLFFGKRFRYVTLGQLRPCPLDEYLFIFIYYSDLFSPKVFLVKNCFVCLEEVSRKPILVKMLVWTLWWRRGGETFWYQIFIFAKVCVEVCIPAKTFFGILYITIWMYIFALISLVVVDLQPKDPVGHSAAAIWGGHCNSHRFAAQSFGFCDFLLSHCDHMCSTDCILPCWHIENGSINALPVKMVLSCIIQIVNRNHISTYWK